MQSLAVTNAAIEMETSPFLPGFNATAMNLSAAPLVLQGSDDGVTYTTLATLGAAGSATGVLDVILPNFIKVSTAATINLLAAL